MQSLMLGLVAALLWGLHDFTLRRIAAKADAAALFLVVLGVGAVLLLPLAIFYGGMRELSPTLLGFSALTGVVYALGVYALYRAFGIGPVRVVAPICGAFPLLSVGFAMAQGQVVGLWVWAACLAVLLGIGVMAQGEGAETKGPRLAAIGWSVLAALGFAVSFAMLHRAISQSDDAEMLLSLIVRSAGFLTILAVVTVQHIDLKTAFSIWPTLFLMGALDVGGMVAVAMAGNFARPEFASVTSSCFGLVTILLAWRFLHEPLTPLQAVGAVVVFCGVAVLGFV
jgi:drug/metabolite transporter (DMT)-like permease